MSDELLITKLVCPAARLNHIPRGRLLHRLGDPWEQGRRLTLISAPAGYGKTTLLADWLRSLPMQTAWLMLEPADNDRARFLAYLIAALQRVYPSAGQAARAMLAAPQPPPGEAILTALLNDLAAQPGRCCLALDDYHVIHTRLIHQQVAFLLEHLPGNLHLAIATREDPLLPVSRLRARGQLTEIRQEDLRFSNEETAGFLQQTMALALDGEDIAALEQRTEGWIAGLQLAAASMQGRSDLKGFVQAFSGSSRFILDYLIEEVFEGQPPEVQEFLLKTSILDCLSAPLCDAVTQISSSQAILEALERANLFILPLDQRRQWYRYHHLFGELLQHRLRLGGFSVKEAHGAASQWFEQNHFPAQAVQHALSGEDWPRAARLIRGVSSDLLKRGEAATLVGWFAALPQEMIWADPRLGFETCWPLLLAGEFEQAAPRLAHVEQMAQGMPEFLGEVLAAQAFLARVRGEHERMQELSQRALALLPKSSLGSRGVLAVNLGLAYWHMGRMADAELILAEALEAGRAIANHYVVFTAMIFQGRILAVRGRLRHAAEAFRLAIAQGGEIPINALAHLDLSALCYEWNDLINSETHLQKAFTLSRRAGNDEFVAACWMMHVCLRAAQGDYRAAQAGLDEAWGMVRSGAISAAMASRVDVSQARLLLAQGKPAEAEGWVEKLTERVDSHPFYRFLGVTRARLLPAAHARAYLAGLSAAAEANGWEYGLIAVRLYQALAAESPVAALEFLEDALRLAQPEGCLRIFAESGPALAPLLIEAARRGVAADYIGRILELIPAGSAPASPGQQVLVEPLSERELQVLRLLAVGLSNREIADKLVISTGTAKTHIHNVSGKLGVRNRTEAAMRAKELHLI